jgi:hypothetical protein
VALLSLLTSPSNGLWSLSLDASPSIGRSSLWHLSLSPPDLSQAGGHVVLSTPALPRAGYRLLHRLLASAVL